VTAAIEVTTETKINHWELGRLFWQWDSEQQAHFLHGMAIGYSEVGGLGPHFQMHAIPGHLEGVFLRDTQDLLAQFHEYFKDET
jgi:hypothetical protein